MNEITRVLSRVAAGEDGALEELMTFVYPDLRAIARNQLDSERANHTLQPTALVHEAYLKLLGQDQVDWKNRAHFFALASQWIRRILLDHARARRCKKRGAGQAAEPLQETRVHAGDRDFDLIELDDALKSLARHEELAAQIVELKFFGGLTIPEIAHALGKSERTVHRNWNLAKAWLFRELKP